MFPKSRKISTYVKKPSLRKNDVESFLLRYSQNSKMGFLTLGILEMSFWTFYPQKKSSQWPKLFQFQYDKSILFEFPTFLIFALMTWEPIRIEKRYGYRCNCIKRNQVKFELKLWLDICLS